MIYFPKGEKVNKYRNQKVVIDNHKFASKKEAARYRELKLLEKGGVISELQLQVKFVLIPKQKGERECSYYADFVYKDSSDETVVEDVKASPYFVTDVYKIKRKLMLHLYGIKIKEIY